jgi:DNA-binding response OmpR family regulator
MSSSPQPHRVLAVNTDRGILDLLAAALQEAGYEPIAMRLADLNADGGLLPYATRLNPDAIVYDVGPPFIENWSRLQGVLATGAITVPVIVTSTNPDALRQHVGNGTVHALVGKPFDLERLAHELRQALDNRAAG